ncbi:hypothetical protein QM327_07895 [Pantoea dispersa]|uniref:hypothetical protein n=1 Tax=Pantoea dispersa TaxID=59814 RepID=UPI0024B85535|nr:hypothetical protein [Pantoea dispersa]MDI9766479.1 hypothetical protein [Pantoea dispersa]
MNNFPAMTEEHRQELIKRFTLEISRLNNKREAAQSEDRYFSGGELWALQAFEIALAALASPPAPVLRVPDGWQLVPIEPTEDMVIRGFESKPDQFWSTPEEWAAYEAMSGCQQAAHKATLCWHAMLAAAPEVE